MNLRTYVRGPDGYPGIWFFSLDARRLAAVVGSRIAMDCRYYWASMRVGSRRSEITYSRPRRFTLQAAHIVRLRQSLIDSYRLRVIGEPLVHFSDRGRARMGPAFV